jgi:hypothetical protein
MIDSLLRWGPTGRSLVYYQLLFVLHCLICRCIKQKRVIENIVCLWGCWTLNVTFLLHMSTMFYCLTMVIEAVCMSLQCLLFQRVAAFFLKFFHFDDHW